GYTIKLSPGCNQGTLDTRFDYWFYDRTGAVTAQSTDTPGLTNCFGGYQSDHVGVRAQFNVTGPVSPTPFYGTAMSLPGTIQAEDFDNGGEQVAYHDQDAGNNGGVYRSTDVDIQAASEGGYAIGWFFAGEWLKYTTNVLTNGTYTTMARVASPCSGASMQLEVDGTPLGSLAVPNTGGWQTWQTVSGPTF